MSSADLEKQAEFIARMIVEDRKKLRAWTPSPEYQKMLEWTRRSMEEAKKLSELVRQKLKAMGEL
jgi:pyruvate-formate lyase-activating enzyme